MEITVKLVGAFRVARFKEKSCEVPEESTAGDIFRLLNLPEKILGFMLINGVHADIDSPLCEGDHLTILPLLDGG